MNEYLSPTLQLQNRFTEADKLNGCTLGLPNLTITKVLSSREKDSSSTSIVCEGTAFGEEVMVKVSFEAYHPEEDNSLQIESEVYEKVIPLLSIHTPNLMPFLAKGECGNFVKSFVGLQGIMDKRVLKVFREEMLMESVTDSYNLNKLQLVVTQKAKGMKLSDWLTNKEFTSHKINLLHFIKDVLLQIAYTLVIFEDFGLMHHDLHSGNVFVEQLPIPLHFSVNVSGKVIVRNIKYFVRIYDFDHSTKVRTQYNDIILNNNLLDSEFCDRLGECNKFYKKKDWFTILQSMYMVYPFLPLISRLVDRGLLNGVYKSLSLVFAGRPCTCRKWVYDCDKCTPIDLEEDGLIVSPHDYLVENYPSCTSRCEPSFHRPLPKFDNDSEEEDEE
jgi:hypothetical protein